MGDRRLQLTLEPEWDEVDRLRDATLAFLRSYELGPDVVDAVAMVACELTENALKYGDFAGRRSVGVAVTLRPQSLLVEVRNPIGEGSGRNLQHMDQMVQWIRGRQDPFEAYLARLQEVSMQDLHERESRLGLVRIAYEGQSILDFHVDDGGWLAVSAMYPLSS